MNKFALYYKLNNHIKNTSLIPKKKKKSRDIELNVK